MKKLVVMFTAAMLAAVSFSEEITYVDIPSCSTCVMGKIPVNKVSMPTNMPEIVEAVRTNMVAVKKVTLQARSEIDDLYEKTKYTVVQRGAELTAAQKANGISYNSNGYEEDGAVQIGRDTKALIPSNTVAGVTTANTKIRNVGVAIGTRAIAEGSSSTKNQSIAIGYSAHSVGSCATAIGPGARHYDDETDETGNNAYANGSTALAIGYSSKAKGTGAMTVGAGISGGDKLKAYGDYAMAIGGAAQATANNANAIGFHAKASAVGAQAIGTNAKATAPGAVQIGEGLNEEENTLKFRGVTIVKNGYIAAASAEPKELTVDDPSAIYDSEFSVEPGSINTLLPSVDLDPGTEVGIAMKSGLRNYELFLPDEPQVRGGMPVNGESGISDPSITVSFVNKVKQVHRLPAKIKVTQPYSRLVLIEVTELDVGTSWQPAITNCNLAWTGSKFATVGSRMLEGEFLNSGVSLKLVYPTSSTVAVTNDIRVVEANRDIMSGTFFYYTQADEYTPKSGQNLYSDGSGNSWYEIIYETKRGDAPATYRKEFNTSAL